VLSSWKEKLVQAASKNDKTQKMPSAPAELTIGQLIGGMKPSELWAVLGAMALLIGGAYTIGAKLVGN
jgi:hypothetical protein